MTTPRDDRLDNQLSRLIIENQSEDGSIDISDQRTMKDEILELIESEKREARLNMIDYFDQVPKNEFMDWKGLFADCRKLLEEEKH